MLAVGFAMLHPVAGADTTRMAIAPQSSIVLTGSSNLAQWKCRGGGLKGGMEVDASIAKINQVIDRIEDGNMSVWMREPSAGRFPQPRFELNLPVNGFRCTGGRPMERDMRNAMRADRNPEIRFRFTEISSPISHDMDAGLYRAIVLGRLSLAGVEREIEVEVTAQRLSQDRFRLRAGIPLRMRDFGIAAPTALFGLIRAADALTAEFDLTLEVAPNV